MNGKKGCERARRREGKAEKEHWNRETEGAGKLRLGKGGGRK